MDSEPRSAGDRLLSDVFEWFPYGIAVTTRTDGIIAWNPALETILGVDGTLAGTTCCELFGCRNHSAALAGLCLTEAAIQARTRLPEIRLTAPGSAKPLWVTAAPIYPDASRVVFQVRPAYAGPAPDTVETPRRTLPRLRIYTLGPIRVETPEGVLEDEWLDQRTGQLLKFLICERHHFVATDVIAEAVWPRPRPATPNTVRYFVHELRKRLEPDRPRHARSSFVQARRGGYALHGEAVWVDADEFESKVSSGLAAFALGETGTAIDHLERALSLYRGDFLSDEPYADWAIFERERLRALAEKPLSLLRELRADDLDAAAAYLERLAVMEPLDHEIQRQLMTVWMKQGRRSRAVRHYETFKLRLLRAFGEQPSFSLADLLP
ncbi:MAG TPA: BTAD domain-containing putative transcriptional regulator [Thermoleophilaceae bacterium]